MQEITTCDDPGKFLPQPETRFALVARRTTREA